MTPVAELALLLPAIGDRVKVPGHHAAFVCRARNDRFAICTKPFNLKRTTLYFIIDAELGWRGPENLVFGLGAESDEDLEAMLARLAGGESSVSRKRGVPWP